MDVHVNDGTTGIYMYLDARCCIHVYIYRVQCYEILQSDWSERGL